MCNGRLRVLPLLSLVSLFSISFISLYRVSSLVCLVLSFASPRSPCLPTTRDVPSFTEPDRAGQPGTTREQNKCQRQQSQGKQRSIPQECAFFRPLPCSLSHRRRLSFAIAWSLVQSFTAKTLRFSPSVGALRPSSQKEESYDDLGKRVSWYRRQVFFCRRHAYCSPWRSHIKCYGRKAGAA